MRITNNMMINSLMNNLDRNLNRMSTSQSHISSTKRIHRASDDPIDAAKVLKYKTDLSEFDQYQKNVRDALSWYDVSESTVSEVGNVLQRTRELAVKAANGVNAPEDLKKISKEVYNLLEQLITSGNFNFAGKYIFSGYQTDKPLFKKDGTYNVDITNKEFANSPKMKLLVGTGEEMQISTNGLDIFGVDNKPNVFSKMFTDTSGDTMSSDKSAIKGNFDLKKAYSGDNLNVTVNGTVYHVDVTNLDGTEEKPLTKEIVRDRLLNALAGGTGPARLKDVAKIYFDGNDNLVVESTASGNIPISMASSEFKFSSVYTGDASTKSVLKGKFTLDGPTANYTTANLDVVTSLGTFHVDEATLNGHSFNITKEMVVDKFRNALLGGTGPQKLSDVADVYFDQDDNLVIKEKQYGALSLSIAGAPVAGYPATLTPGKPKQEATLSFGQFTFNDTLISDNQEELKKTPIYMTYDGERKAVYLSPTANITTASDYQAELQKAIDTTFGLGKITATLSGTAPNHYFDFSTTGTQDGQVPELKVEVIKSKKSSLIEDVRAFHKSLETNDRAGLQLFLSKVDGHLDRVISVRADIGAKSSRMELISNRLSANTLSFTGMLSKAQDVDMAKEIMFLKNAENVYRASLSTGSRVIQPTLVDFLR